MMGPRDLGGTVHLWTIRCGSSNSDARGAEWLSAEERTRADAFCSAGLQARFRAAHIALRGILGHYLGCSPDALGFRTDSLGKPALTTECDLRFNLSHSEDIAVVGVGRGRELGVDVERVPSATLVDETEQLVFTDRERLRLAATPEPARRGREFARLWTRKEAYLKALGAGLSLRLGDIDVSMPGNRVWVRNGKEWRPDARWTLQSMLVADQVPGAVAAEGSGWQLRSFSWPEDAACSGIAATG